MNEFQRDKKNDNWFLRTSFKISIIGGAFAAANKMKGPLREKLNSIFQNKIKKIVEREAWKSNTTQNYFGPDSSIYNGLTSIKGYDDRISEDARNTYSSTKNILSKRIEVDSIENRILSQMERDIYNSKNPGHKGIAIDPSLTQQLDIDHVFFELRRDSLWKYLQHNVSLGKEDYSLIASLKDPEKDKIKMREIYNLYLDNDPDFARVYINNLSNARNEYSKKISRYAMETKEILTPEIVKSHLINIKKSVTVEEAFRLRVGSTITAKNILTEEDKREILSGKKRITAGNLNTNIFVPDRFKPTGDFEYTSQLKQINTLIENIKDGNSFKYFDWNIVNLGYDEDPRLYLRLSASRIGQVGNSIIDVPIAQFGKLPGSNPFAIQRKDFMLYRDQKNATNLALHNVIKILGSTAINDPDQLFSRLRSSINNSLRDSPLLEGNLRDAPSNIIMKDKRYSNNLRLGQSLGSMRELKRLATSVKHNGAIMITLDLETLSPKKYGPNIQAKENFTFITQAGYSVAEYTSKGKVIINDMVEYVSDHAIDKLKVLGFTNDQAQWVKQYLPLDIQNSLKGKGVDDIMSAWTGYQRGLVKRQGVSFTSDHQMAAKIINEIINIVESNKDKKVYLGTKFGTEFDLKILSLAAPDEFAKLKKIAPHLDIHGIAHLKQFVKDDTESLSQTHLLQQLMGRAGIKDLDFSKSGDTYKGIVQLTSKHDSNLVFSNTMLTKLKQYQAMSAHNAGTDAMLLHLLGGYEVNDYISNQKKYDTEWDEVEHLFRQYNHMSSLDEQYKEAKGLEKTFLNGHLLSSTMLSHGKISKQFLSDMSTREFLVSPDNPPAKQWNQLGRGNPVVMSNAFNRFYNGLGSDIAKRKALHNLMLVPSFVTKGYIDATSYIRGADAEKNLFSNTLVNRVFYTTTAFGDQEGMYHMAHDVLKSRHQIVTQNVRLSEIATNAEDPQLNTQLSELYSKIEKEANRLKTAEGIEGFAESRHFQVAAANVMSSENQLAKIPANTYMKLSEGGQGVFSFKSPIDGKLTNLNIFSREGKVVDIYGKIEYLITHENCDKFSFVMRGLGSKAMGIVDKMTTQGLMYGGVKMWGPGQFLDKGYTGATKTLIYNTGFQNLLDKKVNGTPAEQIRAERLLKKWAREMNAEYLPDKNQIVQMNDKGASFNSKIMDAQLEGHANNYIGNINMNINKLGSFMIQSDQIWTLEKAQQWYNFHGGEENLKKLYAIQVKRITDDIDNSTSEIGKAMQFLDKNEREKIKVSNIALLRHQYLPDMKKITAGKKLPMLLQAREKYKGSDIWNVGAELTDYVTMYGYLNGMDARTTQVKLHSSLQTQMDIDNNPMLTPATKRLWKHTKSRDFAGKLRGVAISRNKFIDALKSKAVVTGNLNSSEIRDLISVKDNLSIEDLKKHPLTSTDKILAAEKYMDIIEDEFNVHGESTKNLVDKIISDMDSDDWAKRMMDHENLTFISQVSANKMAIKGKEKGAFRLSANKKLGGVFTLDLNDAMARLSDKEKLPSFDTIMNVFEKLKSKHGEKGFIRSINKSKKLIEFNSLILDAPVHTESIVNLLTKNMGEKGFGHTSIETFDILKVLRSMDRLTVNIENPEGNINIKESQKELMTNWLSYFLRKTRESETENRVPWGWTDRTKDANSLVVKLQEIMNTGGFEKIKGFNGNVSEANAWATQKIKNFTLEDVFIHEENWKKNSVVNVIENEATQMENQYDRMVKTLGKEKAEQIWRSRTLTGTSWRYPSKQAGIHAGIESRFNIIPAEIADMVGVDVNSSFITAEHWKRINGDNDGDAIFKVMHAFDTERELLFLNRDHRRSARRSLDSIAGQAEKGMEPGSLRTLRDITNEKKLFISRTSEGVMLGGWKDGHYVSQVYTPDSLEVVNTFDSAFKSLGSTFTQIGLHDPKVITPFIVNKFIDQSAMIGVAKNAIGVFTNIVDTRSRQLLKMGLKDNIITPRIIGGVETGLSALSQMPVSLVKHPEDLLNIAKASKALINPLQATEEESIALKRIMTPLFHKDDLEMVHNMLIRDTKEYYKKLGPKEGLLRYAADVGESMELGKPNSFLDIISTQFGEDLIRFPEQIPKQLNPNTQAFFKKSGKIGAIGAAVYIATNFFRSNQLSSSINPMDAFTDLGVDIDGSHNGVLSDLELERGVPLDMVNASFSKQAFIKMNSDHKKRDRSKIINNILNNGYKNTNPLLADWKTSPNLSYTNYISNIGYFGSSQLDRRANY
jgi:hypothetical protein